MLAVPDQLRWGLPTSRLVWGCFTCLQFSLSLFFYALEISLKPSCLFNIYLSSTPPSSAVPRWCHTWVPPCAALCHMCQSWAPSWCPLFFCILLDAQYYAWNKSSKNFLFKLNLLTSHKPIPTSNCNWKRLCKVDISAYGCLEYLIMAIKSVLDFFHYQNLNY